MTVWTAGICLLGALLTALSPNFAGMAAGRLLFGIGAETFGIATLAALAQYFVGGKVAAEATFAAMIRDKPAEKPE